MFLIATLSLVSPISVVFAVITQDIDQNKRILTQYKAEQRNFKNGIENRRRYYSDEIIKIQEFYFESIWLDKKKTLKYFIFDVFYKGLIVAKLLLIMIDNVEEFIREYEGTKYLVLFVPEK